MWAIIGSSGFEQFDELKVIETLPRETPFGLCSNGFYRVEIDGIEALFLCRTGIGESWLPSHINYRANIYALKKYGATAILALSSVRSLQNGIRPGDMVVPSQYLDRTKGNRPSTFCDDGLLSYVSLSDPTSLEAAHALQLQQHTLDFTTHFDVGYVCIEGPQFPTRLEAYHYQQLGADVIGMTAFPEFVLAREAGLHYFPCHFIVDYVPWNHEVNNVDCILQVRHDNYDKALSVIRWSLKHLTTLATQDCAEQGIAGGLNQAAKQLTPVQDSWLNVIARQPQTSETVVDTALETTLHHGTKPLPQKLQSFLDFLNKYHKGQSRTVENMRKMTESTKLYAGKAYDIASVRDFSIKLSGTEIGVRLYHPNPEEKLPVMVYVHGGGFVTGDLDVFDSPSRGLSHFSDHVVLAVDYRLAPEHPYPNGLNDVYDVCQWAHDHAHDLKVNANDGITIAGDSAGANLAALAAAKASKTNDFQVAQLVLMYPTTDLTHNVASMQQFAAGYLLEASAVNWYKEQYLPGKDLDLQDPAISPLYEPDMTCFPRTLVMTAGYDPLRDEGLLFAQKMIDQNRPVHHYHFDDMVHGFLNFGKLVPEAVTQLYKRVGQFVKEGD